MKVALFLLLFLPALALADADEEMIEVHEKPVSVTLNEGKVGLRYRFQQSAEGAPIFSTLQDGLLFDLSISFFKDRASIDMLAGTGSGFDGGWNGTGIGSQEATNAFNLRRLALTLGLVSGLEITAGSMVPEYGAGTENTTFDNDGYIMGYRAAVSA